MSSVVLRGHQKAWHQLKVKEILRDFKSNLRCKNINGAEGNILKQDITNSAVFTVLFCDEDTAWDQFMNVIGIPSKS